MTLPMHLLAALLVLCVPLAAQQPAPSPGPAPDPILDEANFEALFAWVLPDEDELEWRKIGWRGVLADAVEEARRTDRPILLWAMNGHPLACT